MKIDFLTVVYKPEVDLLINQGASFDLRVDSENVGNIFIMINDQDESIKYQIQPSWYKKHADKVKILTRQDINYLPGPQEDGWHTQQMVKLLGTAVSNNEWLIVIDSKTWFARDFKIDELFENNKAKCNLMVCNDWFKPGTEKFGKMLGIETSSCIWPNGVPHFMRPEVNRQMMNYVSQLTSQPFQTFFESNNKSKDMITEFICYDVYCQWSGDYEKYYIDHQTTTHVKNLADWELENFDQWVNRLNIDNPLTVSIKGEAFKKMTAEQRDKWHHYLSTIGLK